jgi:hypothetical protein
MGLFDSEEEKLEQAKHKFYSKERYHQVAEYVSEGEKVEGILNISGVTHDDDDDSFLGENQGSGFRTSNQFAIFTNERILIRLPGFIHTDTSSIGYQNVKSVETKNGMVKRKLVLRTSGEDYHIVALDNNEVVQIAANHVREKIRGGSSSDSGPNEKTPTEKIEDLKNLYDKGIISEEEFKSKKSELLDKI